MIIAAKALGRNETSEKKVKPTEEMQQQEEQEDDNPYLEEGINQEEVQVEKIEQQDHFPSG